MLQLIEVRVDYRQNWTPCYVPSPHSWGSTFNVISVCRENWKIEMQPGSEHSAWCECSPQFVCLYPKCKEVGGRCLGYKGSSLEKEVTQFYKGFEGVASLSFSLHCHIPFYHVLITVRKFCPDSNTLMGSSSASRTVKQNSLFMINCLVSCILSQQCKDRLRNLPLQVDFVTFFNRELAWGVG